MMDAAFGFECDKCGYAYEHRMGPTGTVLRVKGERTPLVYRVVTISDCTPTPGELPPPPFVLVVCPACGRIALTPHEEQMKKFIAHVKLPILPSAEGLQQPPKPPKASDPPVSEGPPKQDPPPPPPRWFFKN